MSFFKFDDNVETFQADDEDKMPANEFQEITSISAQILDLGYYGDAIPTLSTFEATLACLREIDQIYIDERALPLLDELFLSRKSKDRHHHLQHIHYISFKASSWSSFGLSLATFILDFKAEILEIYLPKENPSKDSFSLFCKSLLVKEKNEGDFKQAKLTPLQKLIMRFRRELTDERVLFIRDQLVDLLISLDNLHLEIEEKDRKRLFDSICSSIPSKLLSRVKAI